MNHAENLLQYLKYAMNPGERTKKRKNKIIWALFYISSMILVTVKWVIFFYFWTFSY